MAGQDVPRNDVSLAGRLSAPGEERVLPSGDVLVAFRVVVDRPAGGLDTIDCAAWRGDVRRTVLRWAAGDVVEVTGALRRRFWRAGGGTASRTEVEAQGARRLAKGPSG